MYQEQTFIDDTYSNAVGSLEMQQNLSDLQTTQSKTPLVGIELLEKENIKIQDYSTLQRSNILVSVKKMIVDRKKDIARLNTLFSRLNYETNNLQRDAIIKQIEPLRDKIKDGIKDFNRLSTKLKAELFVDLSKPIKFVSTAEAQTGRVIPKFSKLIVRDVPINVDGLANSSTPTINITPTPNVPAIPLVPFPSGGGGGVGVDTPLPEEPKNTEDKIIEEPKKPNYILWGLGGLALVYFLFLRKRN